MPYKTRGGKIIVRRILPCSFCDKAAVMPCEECNNLLCLDHCFESDCGSRCVYDGFCSHSYCCRNCEIETLRRKASRCLREAESIALLPIKNLYLDEDISKYLEEDFNCNYEEEDAPDDSNVCDDGKSN